MTGSDEHGRRGFQSGSVGVSSQLLLGQIPHDPERYHHDTPIHNTSPIGEQTITNPTIQHTSVHMTSTESPQHQSIFSPISQQTINSPPNLITNAWEQITPKSHSDHVIKDTLQRFAKTCMSEGFVCDFRTVKGEERAIMSMNRSNPVDGFSIQPTQAKFKSYIRFCDIGEVYDFQESQTISKYRNLALRTGAMKMSSEEKKRTLVLEHNDSSVLKTMFVTFVSKEFTCEELAICIALLKELA